MQTEFVRRSCGINERSCIRSRVLKSMYDKLRTKQDLFQIKTPPSMKNIITPAVAEHVHTSVRGFDGKVIRPKNEKKRLRAFGFSIDSEVFDAP